MYGDTVTLFNYHTATDMWYPTVIYGADLGASEASSRSETGVLNTGDVTLLINCEGSTTVSGKQYLTPKEYAVCADPAAHFTFKPKCDFFVSGDLRLYITSDSSYESGLYHELNEKRDGVYMITSAEYFGLLPHFEIGGR